MEREIKTERTTKALDQAFDAIAGIGTARKPAAAKGKKKDIRATAEDAEKT